MIWKHYFAFVSSRLDYSTTWLDYCNSLLAGQPSCQLDRLQLVQNAAARMYSGLARRSSVTPVLRDDLHWLKIPQRISYKLCTIVYRCLNGTAPEYLTNFCQRLTDQHSRVSRNRSAAAGNLSLPRTRLKTYGQRTFAVSGPTAWNSLPVYLKSENSFSIFKVSAKNSFI